MANFDWVCPFCSMGQIATDQNHESTFVPLFIGDTAFGKVGIKVSATRCLNKECNQPTIASTFTGRLPSGGGWAGSSKPFEYWRLRPASFSKPQPDYIPKPLRDDYYEACAVRDLSPKASATLSRRCLQGMIRHFCGISKARLIDEIKALREAVDDGKAPSGVMEETMDAIDAVREIGNIGAHMDKDINLIVEVDPGEAQALIELIEMLFTDWYVARHRRQERLKKVQRIAQDKGNDKKKEKAASAEAAPPEAVEAGQPNASGSGNDAGEAK